MSANISEKLFTGDTKYTIGLLFVLGNIAGFFVNMKKLKISDTSSYLILILLTIVGKLLS